MAAAAVYALPAPFLARLIEILDRYRLMYVEMRGEFALWFEEAFADLQLPRMNAASTRAVRGALFQQVQELNAEAAIGIGEFQTGVNAGNLITIARLRHAVQNGTGLRLQLRQINGTYVLKDIPANAVPPLLQFVEEAIQRFVEIRNHGMDGAPDDWTRQIRFIVTSNQFIVNSFVPPDPPNPLPANYQPPMPKCSPILPELSYRAKYVTVSSTACLRNVVNRHRRLFPGPSAAFFHDNFPNGMDWDSKDDVDQLWALMYKPDQFLFRENGKSNYPERPRVFRKNISTDGEGASVLFEKFVSRTVLQAAVPAAEELDEDDEKAARAKVAQDLYRKTLQEKFDKVLEAEEKARRGECRIRVQGLDPGIGSMVTEARDSGRTDGNGDVIYDAYDITPKQFHAEAGYTKRRDKLNRMASQASAQFNGRSVADINNGTPSRRLPNADQLRARIVYRLTHLRPLVEFYFQFRGDRFQNYKGKQETVERVVEEIINMERTKPMGAPKTAMTKKQKENARRAAQRSEKMAPRPEPAPPWITVIAFGTAKVGSMGYIKGHLRGPMKAIVKTLDRRPDAIVAPTDEFNTSKVHHKCGRKTLDSRPCRHYHDVDAFSGPWHPPLQLPQWHPPMDIPVIQPW